MYMCVAITTTLSRMALKPSRRDDLISQRLPTNDGHEFLLQVVIVVAFGSFCFGCGYLTAFIVTRNQWRDEM